MNAATLPSGMEWLKASRISGLLLVWNPLITAVFTFVLSGTHTFVSSWLTALVIADTCMLQSQAVVRLLLYVEASWARRRGLAPPMRSMTTIFLCAAIALPCTLPLGFLLGKIFAGWLGVSWGEADLRSYRIGIGFGVVCLIVFFVLRTRADAREEIRVLENKRLHAQLAALTAEMNPHLLFNALNTVASLIHADPDRAEEVVLQLSALYRGVLRSAGSATHSLREELALCEAYLQVERARFGERLRMTIDIERDVDTSLIEVPVLVLQPFVENAVKHGLSPRARGGSVRLEIRRRGDRIEALVEDDGVGFGQSTNRGAGRAMANCKERLALTYGRSAELEVGARDGGGTRVLVSLPEAR